VDRVDPSLDVTGISAAQARVVEKLSAAFFLLVHPLHPKFRFRATRRSEAGSVQASRSRNPKTARPKRFARKNCHPPAPASPLPAAAKLVFVLFFFSKEFIKKKKKPWPSITSIQKPLFGEEAFCMVKKCNDDDVDAPTPHVSGFVWCENV
jgi:hypothetical protein